MSFIVLALLAENRRTSVAGEVLAMVLPAQRRYVRPSQRLPATEAEKIQSFEVIRFAQSVLVGWLVGNRKEIGRYDFATVLFN